MNGAFTNNSDFHTACDLVESAVIEEDKSTSIEVMKKGLALLEELYRTSPESEELNYALGYAWYNYAGDEHVRSEKVVEYFNNVLLSNSSHGFANLYMGHYHFDRNEYEEALTYFEKVDPERYFPDQIWRIIKLKELILCSNLRVAPEEVELEQCDNFIKEYMASDEEDRPVIRELRETVNYLKEEGNRSDLVEKLIKFSDPLEY